MALIGIGGMLGASFGMLVGGSVADLLSLASDTVKLAFMAGGGIAGAVFGVEFMRRNM